MCFEDAGVLSTLPAVWVWKVDCQPFTRSSGTKWLLRVMVEWLLVAGVAQFSMVIQWEVVKALQP